MTTVLLALMMQYVVAAKAGLVNHVQGFANVRSTQMVKPTEPIRTGPNGYVELLLTPGAFLRVGNNSEVVLDNVNLASVNVRVNVGTAVVEVVEPTGAYPLKVKAGDLTVDVADPGIYEFNADGHATVIEGKLRTGGAQGITYKKGWQLSYLGNYRAQKIQNPELTALDVYSKKRSELIARASLSLISEVDRTSMGTDPYWLFSQILGAWTLIPYRNIRSPYGFNYAGLNDYRQAAYASPNSPNPNTSPSNNNFPANAPAATNNPSPGSFSVPSGDRQTGGSYSNSKAPAAAAQQPPPLN